MNIKRIYEILLDILGKQEGIKYELKIERR